MFSLLIIVSSAVSRIFKMLFEINKLEHDEVPASLKRISGIPISLNTRSAVIGPVLDWVSSTAKNFSAYEISYDTTYSPKAYSFITCKNGKHFDATEVIHQSENVRNAGGDGALSF